jgi:hypothetical protein
MRWLAGISMAVTFLAIGAKPSVAAAPRPCAEYGTLGFCVEWEDGSTDTAGSGGGSSPASVSTEVVCYWETLEEIPSTAVSSGFLPGAPTDVPLVWQQRVCTDGSRGTDPLDSVRWAVAPTIAPEDLAAAARARLSRLLPAPDLETSPPIGTPAIIGVPTFVAVENWTGSVSESECAAGLCVTVTAAPVLTFTPGEPEAPIKECTGRGTRHRAGADPHDEATRAGACAHAFDHRTAVAERPQRWPGSVAVTWSISWSASSGESASMPSVTRTTSLPRAVEEVQAPVVGGELP